MMAKLNGCVFFAFLLKDLAARWRLTLCRLSDDILASLL